MPKTLSMAMQGHVAGETVSLAKCLHITRRTDGVELFFTDHDVPLVIDGDTYQTGVTFSSVKNSCDFSVEQVEITGLLGLTLPSITAQDIRVGYFDMADAELFFVNFRDLTQGRIALRNGLLGNTILRGEEFVIELRGLTQYLQALQGAPCQPTCRANFTDVFCALDAADFEQMTTVAAVTDRRTFTATALTPGTPTDDWFTAGLVSFTSGANSGFSREIAVWTEGTDGIQTFLPFPFDIAPGDAITVLAGCRKRFLEDCVQKFDNGVNFIGEPLLPGRDKLLDVPDNTT